MTRSNRVTEEQIAAAQLRVYLDQKQGRFTPELVEEIANSVPGDEVVGLGTNTSDGLDATSQRPEQLPLYGEIVDYRVISDPDAEDSDPTDVSTVDIRFTWPLDSSSARVWPIEVHDDAERLTLFKRGGSLHGHRHKLGKIVWLPHEVSEETVAKLAIREWQKMNPTADKDKD